MKIQKTSQKVQQKEQYGKYEIKVKKNQRASSRGPTLGKRDQSEEISNKLLKKSSQNQSRQTERARNSESKHASRKTSVGNLLTRVTKRRFNTLLERKTGRIE